MTFPQPETMLPSRALRKALMDQYGFSAADIAAKVQPKACSPRLAAHVISGKGKFETPNSRQIKQLFAARVKRPVEELWRDEIAAQEPRKARTSRRVRKAS